MFLSLPCELSRFATVESKVVARCRARVAPCRLCGSRVERLRLNAFFHTGGNDAEAVSYLTSLARSLQPRSEHNRPSSREQPRTDRSRADPSATSSGNAVAMETRPLSPGMATAIADGFL